jgi:uncharacterized protein YdaU (DUF1376 family)
MSAPKEREARHSIEAGEPWPHDPYPYLRLYGGDIMKGTLHLSHLQGWALVLLIVHYWHHGSLPKEHEVLARITRMDEKTWRKNSETILAQLRQTIHEENDAGLITQRKGCIEDSKKKSESGRKGAESRWRRPRLGVCNEATA